mmetsp:Transcript_14158/g.46505  ORF Transcript_14158/g.46505 Transcript_14158/m.46505 type:complete len:363 (+) Transcript_14158:191-1279(+)
MIAAEATHADPGSLTAATLLSPEYRESAVAFLRGMHPRKYGPVGGTSTAEQEESCRLAAQLLVQGAMAAAAAQPDGVLPASEDPVRFAKEDGRNIWALSERLGRPVRFVHLELSGVRLSVRQEWADDMADRASSLESYSTGYLCWDGSVVLADFLTHAPAVIVAQHPTLARLPHAAHAWSWSGKRVVELGCGAAPLPAIAAALQGAAECVATDGDDAVLALATRNAAEAAAAGNSSSRARVRVEPLCWGEGAEASLFADGNPVADVVLGADVLYVLSNPGAWGALLRTLLALCGPSTICLIAYADRGNRKSFKTFLQKAAKSFRVLEVPRHLLHPVAERGCPDRIEHQTGPVQIFSFARLPP